MYAGRPGGNRHGVAGLGPQHFPGGGDELRQDQSGGRGGSRLEVLPRGGERPLGGGRRLRGVGRARLPSRVSSACSRRRWFLADTARGGSSDSAVRSTSQSANSPSRFGPRTAAPTSARSRPSAGVVA